MKKKLLSLLLLLCLVITVIPATDTQAAVNLNKTKISIYVGKTYTLKVSGTSKTVKWSSNKKTVATVTSKGVVKGIKAGVAKITATVNSKKYVCTVTVKKKATTNYNSKVTYEAYETADKLVVLFYNQNTCNINLSANVIYYDASGKMLSQSSDYTLCMQKNKHRVMRFTLPYDANYDYADYSSYKISFTATAASSYYKSYVNNIDISSNQTASNDVMAEFVNTGSKEIGSLQFTCIFYQSNKVVGSYTTYAYNLAAGTSTVKTFYAPEDRNYDYINYDSYKIYVDEAYTSTY